MIFGSVQQAVKRVSVRGRHALTVPLEEEGEKRHFPVAWAVRVCITCLIQPCFTTRCRRASSLDRLIPARGLGLLVLGARLKTQH